MDLNQLYFDHQLSLIRADEAVTSMLRQGHQIEAARIAQCIGQRQTKIGAAAARAWEQSA